MKHFSRYALVVMAAASLVMAAGAFAQSAGKAKTKPAVSKSKVSYMVGRDLASQLPQIIRDEINPAIVAKALQDALSGKKSTMSRDEANQVRKAFFAQLRSKNKAEAAKNKREGAAYLAANKKKSGVKTTASGLQYQVIKSGTGPHPGPKDTVMVNYKLTSIDGTVIDSSAKHKSGPNQFPLASVVPGFREGLELMQVGSHYKLFIPPALGYGEHPGNGTIPPNATLIFEVKLVKTTPPSPASSSKSSGGH